MHPRVRLLVTSGDRRTRLKRYPLHKAHKILLLTEDDFAWISAEICAVAARCCEGRVVSTLEGGYDLDALAASAVAHVAALAAASG